MKYDSKKIVADSIRQVALARSAAGRAVLEHTAYVHKWSGRKRKYESRELLPPEELFVASRFDVFEIGWSISVGGSRSPTVEAFRQAHEISFTLARSGATIISGGVPGIDLAAHLGALDSTHDRLATMAVLANPVTRGLLGHPWPSVTISNAIAEYGAFISEYCDEILTDSIEFKERLLQRDRVISAMSDVLLVFECSVDSATVDTARRANLQGKRVLGVRPPIRTSRAGVDQLLDEGIAEEFSFDCACK